jgi:DNA-binding transcriptional ArsR family regulator
MGFAGTLPRRPGVMKREPADADNLTVIYCREHIKVVTTTFEVLSEPNRRQILDLLLAQERPVGELVEAMGVSQPAVSKHLRVLRQAGLVESRTDAQRRIYRVRPEPLRDVDRWLEPYRSLWASRLDALESRVTMRDQDPAPRAPSAATRRTRS